MERHGATVNAIGHLDHPTASMDPEAEMEPASNKQQQRRQKAFFFIITNGNTIADYC